MEAALFQEVLEVAMGVAGVGQRLEGAEAVQEVVGQTEVVEA